MGAIILVAGVCWLAWAAMAHALMRASVRPGDPWVGLAMVMLRLHARVVQRLRVEGREHIPRGRRPGPLVVIANHTAGVDPLLVQAVCGFEITWMMARDMQAPGLEWFWEFAGVISVNRVEEGDGVRRGSDAAAARAAIKLLKEGGVVGVFPEGRIAPAGRIVPFAPGVGLLVSRTGARVMQVVIDGTRRSETMAGSLLPARARLRVLPVREYEGVSAGEIAKDLERRLVAETGWRFETSTMTEQ